MDARSLMVTLMGERARFVRLARRSVVNETDADDIVQHALMSASESAGSLEDPARARAWFYRILRNTIADHHRGRRGDPMQHRADADVAEIAADAAAPRALCKCGVRLLDKLRPAYAEVVRRVDVDGEDAAVVARALGISIDNLRVRLHRARATLRNDVQGYCGVSSHRPCLDCACDGDGDTGTETGTAATAATSAAGRSPARTRPRRVTGPQVI